MRLSLPLGLVLVFLAPWLGCPAVAAEALIDDCQYSNDAAARTVWQPMRGSSNAAVALVNGRNALRLFCNFAGTKIERASWDRPVKLDLISSRGIQFKILCRDASAVSHFSLYFQSGEGWYHAAFFPESSTGWNTVSIDKAAMQAEGQPAGWGQIKTIRISAWRGKDVNTEFYLGDIRKTGALGADAVVAVIRSEPAGQRSPEEARSAGELAESMAENLRALDIGCAVSSDLEVTADRLQQAKLVILPYNPHLSDRAADELKRYLDGGGKLLAFYAVPERLHAALKIAGGNHLSAAHPGQFSAIRFEQGALPGVPPVVNQQSWNINAFQPVSGASRVLAEWLDDKGQPTGHPAVLGSSNCLVMTHVLLSDDAMNKRRLLLAMVGWLVPEVWRQATDAAIARIGTIGGFQTFDEAVRRLAESSRQEARVTNTLAAARTLRESALSLASQSKFAEALDQAAAASGKVIEAFCLAQQPVAGEFRAFWCHSAFGVTGMSWDEAVGRLADNGFTAILPNMLWGGAAFCHSKILPVVPQIAKRGDQISQCVAACRKHGLQIHVWKVNWNLGSAAPKAFVDRLRHEGRLQASSEGKEQLWLCPSHPENRKLEINSLVEVVRQYDVDGVHFDYIRYPDGDHCFCAGCKERFQRITGLKIRNWPKDVLAEGPVRQRWLDWRRSNITAIVKAVSQQARAIKPRIKLSAAVFSNWTTDRDSVGQDWKLWCEKGYLDFVCPMDYTPSKGRFENMVARQVLWAGRTSCYPGIGVSASASHFGVDRVIEQINLTRRQGTRGFVIFNYGVTESKDLLPMLGLGITAKR
jgi:uncharacterized lipoprotein YddW (UPF0748 family)